MERARRVQQHDQTLLCAYSMDVKQLAAAVLEVASDQIARYLLVRSLLQPSRPTHDEVRDHVDNQRH